jgi:hypothetical protein
VINEVNYDDIIAALERGDYYALCGTTGYGNGYLADPLVQAFNFVSTVFSSITQALIDTEDIIPIYFTSIPSKWYEGKIYGQTQRRTAQEGKIDVTGILMDNSLTSPKMDPAKLIGTLAEECFHALMGTLGFFTASRFEEYCAESFNQKAKSVYNGLNWQPSLCTGSMSPDMSYDDIQGNLNAWWWNFNGMSNISHNEPVERSFGFMWWAYSFYLKN